MGSKAIFCRICHPDRDPKYWAKTPCYSDDCLRRINLQAKEIVDKIIGCYNVGDNHVAHDLSAARYLRRQLKAQGKRVRVVKHDANYKVEVY